MSRKLRVVILKPSKYAEDGYVERFRWGFMPNSTVPYLTSMTPKYFQGFAVEIHAVDEYVQSDLGYLELLKKQVGFETLLALVGVQSHQFQRALDLAAYAVKQGVIHCVIGGPHPMTCDTTMLQNRGISFALAEAELVWPTILADAIQGELQPSYGQGQRWQKELDPPVLTPPPKKDLRRYFVPMLGIYPARGCPFKCSFCSVIKIAGRHIRSQSIETTIKSLLAAKAAGVRLIMFTSDNFNKYSEASLLLEAMVEEKINLPFFVQCDTQVARQEQLVALLAKAGCFQMFLGVESFNRQILREVQKHQNHPERYREITDLCRAHGIGTHFSNIIGFPADTEEGILEHLRRLRDLDPDLASFYILTPIPGTEQYDEFLQKGLLTEHNLDRFDGSCVTWRHPHLTNEQLTNLLFHCYRQFYSLPHVLKKSVRRYCRVGNLFFELLIGTGLPLFSRFAVLKKMHPMSGGVGRVTLDNVKEYLALRKELFGFSMAPLPSSLELSAADKALNSMAKIALS